MQQRYLIGTLFQEEELNKKMNANSVKLKDPMGNVRWKGAFTGGFEAGFKNTCGSKEGWTPASFVSVIGGNRGQRKEQSIFDFMDKQDLGREAIGQNISMQANFSRGETNSLNISFVQSMGQKILSNMKKKSAFMKAPEDIKELDKLLQNYAEQQNLIRENQNYNLKGIQSYSSVGATEEIPNDDFIAAYEDFFRKIIRAGAKEETQQQIAKRREENKVYFDFTKPLEEEPEYLKQIQQVEELSKPKKRRRNTINDKKLRDLFKMGSGQLHIGNQLAKFKEEVPEDYDPYHRIKEMKEKEKQFMVAIQEKRKHRVQSLNQRSDVLNEGKLASRFVSAGASVSTNKFVRAGQQETVKGLEKVFDDEKKNKRYWDYVLEMQGKKISAQLEYLSYEQAQKQKLQFQKIYELKSLPQHKDSSKGLPKKVQEAIQSKNKKEVRVIRKTGFWKPQKLLCKRFGCMLPYKEQKSHDRHNRN